MKSVFEIAPVSGEIISANDAFDAYDKAFTALDAGRRDLAIKHLTTAILATGGAVPIGGLLVRGGKKAARGRVEAWLRGRLSDGKFAEWLKRQRDGTLGRIEQNHTNVARSRRRQATSGSRQGFIRRQTDRAERALAG